MLKKINSFFEKLIALTLVILPSAAFAWGWGSDDPLAKGFG